METRYELVQITEQKTLTNYRKHWELCQDIQKHKYCGQRSCTM